MASSVSDDAAESVSQSRRALSRRFCYVLEAGGWKKQKEKAKQRTRMNELIDNCGRNEFQRFVGGSQADGTALQDSDTDFMFLNKDTFIINNADDVSRVPYPASLFLMEQDGHRPCYPALRMVRVGCSDKMKPFLEKRSEFTYLSSAKIKRRNIEHANDLYGQEIIEEHGPCAQISFGAQDNRMSDMSYSIPCVSWPFCAMEWIHRNRTYGTPSKKIIQEVIDTACSVVPKCNERMQDLEWRISFLLGERILVWNLTPTQYYCFIYMKQVMKSFLSKEFQDILSSFVMKSVLFWEIEETDPCIWQEDFLLDRITDCLSRLKSCIQERHLPHYFARENNIFTAKISVENSQKIVSMLSSISKNLKFFCHECFSVECSASSCVICHDASLLLCKKGKGLSRCIVPSYFDKVDWWDTGADKTNLTAYVAKLNVLSDCNEKYGVPSSLREYTREITATGIGIACNRKAMENSGADVRATYNSLAEQFYKLGENGENVTGKLHMCGFYCQQGRFEKASRIIIQLKNRMYFDPELKAFIRLKEGNALVDEDIVCGELTDAEQMITMHFHSEDSCRVHYVIAMECVNCTTRIDCVEIHLLVYLSFLQFLVFYHSDSFADMHAALKLLEDCVLLSYRRNSFVTACNVAGYCHSMTGDVVKALEYFWKSFCARPSLHNACLYLSVIIIKRYTESKQHS